MIEDLFRAILKVPPSQRKIQADLSFMYKELKPWSEELIPFEEESELEILSLNQQKKWVKQTWGRILKGVLNSIYHEPMVTYAYKNYIKDSTNALIYVKTTALELIYRVRKNKTQVYLNRQILGTVTHEGLLYGGRKNRLLGRIQRYSEEYYKVIIWDKEVAHVLDPKKIDRINPRAFEILEDMAGEEEQLFLSLALLKIIERINDFNWSDKIVEEK